MRTFLLGFALGVSAFAQTPGTALAAGAAAGAALGAGQGQSSTTSSSATGAGGGTAPIEIQLMAYHGLQKIAASIARAAAAGLGCPVLEKGKPMNCGGKGLLIEDPSSSTQIGLYHAALGYYEHLGQIHAKLEPLSLVVSPGLISIPQNGGSSTVTLTNIGSDTLAVTGINVSGPGDSHFSATPTSCTIAPSGSCQITVTFTAPVGSTIQATLNIPNPSPAQSVQSVALTGTVPALGVVRPQIGENAAPLIGAGGAVAPVGGGSGSSSTAAPVGLTDFGSIVTALGGLKTAMTYTSSSLQPTTQTFELMMEKELQVYRIHPYTSTSALDLRAATEDLKNIFGNMLRFGTDVTNWANQCKPAAGSPGGAAAAAKNPECGKPENVANLAVAQQLISGYTGLLLTSSDSTGSPVILDLLRGEVLSKKMEDHIPSLQVSVSAAAGSTRTNSFFLLNLFYVPKPSYNAGAVATFELRNAGNEFVDGGVRTALFDYTSTKKLLPGAFATSVLEDPTVCGSFCRDR